MSNEAVNKIKSNITKSILGVSIAGVMIAGGATQIKAETVENPTAIVHEVKEEDRDNRSITDLVNDLLDKNDQALNSGKKEELTLTSVNGNNEEEVYTDVSQSDDNGDKAADQEGLPEGKHDITLDEFIKDDTLDNIFNFDASEADAAENLDVEEEKAPEAQTAGEDQKSTEPNYADDEKNIKDYSEEERYRSTQMEQGNGTAADYIPPDEMDKFIDGYRYHSSEPSATSEDKTQWGVEIEIDKEKGQRTYTDFYFTNGANLGDVLETGNVSANEAGDTITGGNKNPNYKATSEIEITGSRVQRNLNLYATEEDLKHINNQDNTNTTMAWQGKYLKDHPNGLKATEGGSAQFGFTVNPWPNENDKLELIKLNGKHDQKEFVQGQTIETGVSVENLDDSARERLVGQVYNPLNGEVVEGAKAYINDQGKVVVKMPDGAVNADGSLNKDSIFYKDPKYKGIQNLEVKFFARPRTADEFKAIVEGNGAGFYTGTGAGTETIKHDGKDVVIDKQGIDRYDHYNLIGGFKLNLDDTRYYDQDFINEEKVKAEDHIFNDVRAGLDYEIKGIDKAT